MHSFKSRLFTISKSWCCLHICIKKSILLYLFVCVIYRRSKKGFTSSPFIMSTSLSHVDHAVHQGPAIPQTIGMWQDFSLCWIYSRCVTSAD